MTRIPLRHGLDFSAEPPGSRAIKASGHNFVIRYAARDYRGLKALELADYRLNGIDVAMVYESTIGRVKDGKSAGGWDAAYAHNFLLEMGLPAGMPIYFAVDYDIRSNDRAAFLQYLQGADEAIGAARVGVYGGYEALDYAADTGVKWLWQTIAWEYGRGLHPDAILYQDQYNRWINGTNCDRNLSYAENFGQASKFEGEPIPIPVPAPAFPKPDLPAFYDRVNAQRHPSAFKYKGDTFYPQRIRVKAEAEATAHIKPDLDSAASAEPTPEGGILFVDWIMKKRQTGRTFLVNGDGYHSGPKFDPQLEIPT